MKRGLLILSLLFFYSCKNSEVLFAQGKLLNPIQEPVALKVTIERQVIFVPVTIEGETYRFLFDSGAPNVVSKELREKLNMKVLKRNPIRDSQGKTRHQNYVRVPSLELGGQVFEDFVAVESDLRFSPILNCLNFDGIIGANLMRKRFWEMNIADSTLIMSATKDNWDLKTKPIYRMPFTTKSTGTPVVQLGIKGKKVKGITFDTGSSGILSLPRSTYDGLSPDSLVQKSYGFLSGGLFGSALDTAEEHVLPFDFPDSTYYFPVEFESAKSAGLLGMRFMRHFKIFMDWPNQEMLLQPLSLHQPNPTWPLSPFYEGALIVGNTNSLMDRQLGLDITIGDTIISCNGVDYSQPNREDLCQIYQQFIKAEESLTLGIKGKGEYTIYRQQPY